MQVQWPVLVLFTVLALNQGRTRPNSNAVPFFLNFDVCHSKICQRDANQLLLSLNQSANPCDDFYEFACGGWLARNKRPRHETTWSQWEPVMQTVEDQVHAILLGNNRSASDVQSLVMARVMYGACMDIAQNEGENTRKLMEIVDEYGGWPMLTDTWSNTNTSWHIQVAKINSDFNIFPLLKFHVSPSLYNTSHYSLYIDHPVLSFPQYILANPFPYKAHIKSYVQWIVHSASEVARIRKLKLSPAKFEQEALELVDFEMQLASLLTTHGAHNVTNFYKQITVEELQLWTDLISAKNQNIIIWTDVMKILIPSKDISTKTIDNVIVKDLVYILELIQLVEKTPKRTITNYLAWSIVKYFAKDVSVSLDNYSFKIDRLLYGIEDNIPRQKHCVSTVNKQMQLPISFEYVRKHVNEQMKTDIELLMYNIKRVLIGKLNSLRWLDEKTKQKAAEKANAMNYLAAYPNYLKNITYIENYYTNLKISRNHVKNTQLWNSFIREKEFLNVDSTVHNFDRWSSTVTDVNAYYSVLENAVILPAGLLQYPFYSAKRLKALNYGAIGTIIGHEFSHAFDNTGRQADKNGNFKQWWTRESLKNYENHLKCFETHYRTLIADILSHSLDGNTKMQINSQRTQDENVADIIGLHLAYTAYVQIKDTEIKFKLPGLEKYTSDQLFFMSFATQWCEDVTREQLVTQLLDTEHTPSQVRIIGALSNSLEFSKAFNCPAKSPMNPKNKCHLW